jgi:hypothetical protein
VELTAAGLTLRDDANPPPMTWDGFLGYLSGLSTDEWCDLYLEQFIPRGEAMRLAARIADQAALVWRDLTPLYHACTEIAPRRGG